MDGEFDEVSAFIVFETEDELSIYPLQLFYLVCEDDFTFAVEWNCGAIQHLFDLSFFLF